MKIFISQVLKNKTGQQIIKERSEILQKIKQDYSDVEIINNYTLLKNYNIDDNEKTSLGFLGECIKVLSTTDMIYFGNDFIKSRECRIEYLCAHYYNIDIIESC